MIQFFQNLTILQSAVIAGLMLLVNVAVIIFCFILVKRKHSAAGEVERTLYFQSLLYKFVLLPLLILSSFFSVFLVMPHIDMGGDLDFLVVFPICLIMPVLLSFVYLAVFHNFNAKIRQTQTTTKKETKEFFRVILIIIIPLFAALILSKVLRMLLESKGINHEGLNIFLAVAPFFMITFFSPLTMKYMTKAKQMASSELTERLNEFLARNGVKNTQLYLWQMADKKIANALVTGFLRKSIYITDYLIQNLTTDEIIAILAHEIWHIKKKHIIKRVLMILPVMLWGLVCGYSFEWYENTYNTEINIVLGLSVILVPMILFATVGIYFLYRKQEEQADRLVVENGVKAEVFASALLKLAKLNHTVVKFNKVDEQFQTHPSYARRIRRILEAGGVRAFDGMGLDV